jgi:adenine/guanine phosphoribosyltransferase-like PRPP-binding protein
MRHSSRNVKEGAAGFSVTYVRAKTGKGAALAAVASMLNASTVPARRQRKVRAAVYLRAPMTDRHQDADGRRRRRYRWNILCPA